MAQIFHARFGLLAKLTLLAGLVLSMTGVLLWRSATATPNALGEPVEQVIPFSHRHHVADDGIDCRYCHSSVETQAFAGIPSEQTCMTCHSQLFRQAPMLEPLVKSWTSGEVLRWQQVHNLPGFVYFNHSIHIAKGVGCETCHGRVDQMALTSQERSLDMNWCVGCHRHPERYLRPRANVFDMAWQPPRNQEAMGLALMAAYHIDTRHLADCSVCHR